MHVFIPISFHIPPDKKEFRYRGMLLMKHVLVYVIRSVPEFVTACLTISVSCIAMERLCNAEINYILFMGNAKVPHDVTLLITFRFLLLQSFS